MAKKANVERDVNAQPMAAVKSELQQAVYGINADVSGAFERMESVAACQSSAKQAEAAYEDSLGDYCNWAHENGFTSKHYTQAVEADYAEGKDDPAYKAQKAFYDAAKLKYAAKLEASDDYSDVALIPLWEMNKTKLEAAGHPKRVSIALQELKADANQGIRKIRERLETLERADDDGNPIPKTEAQRDAANLAAIYKRKAGNEDTPADEQRNQFAALQVCAVEMGCELEYIALISEI